MVVPIKFVSLGARPVGVTCIPTRYCRVYDEGTYDQRKPEETALDRW